MKEGVKRLTLAYLVFMLLFMLSGALDGAISDIVYVLSFVAPVLLVILTDKSGRARSIAPMLKPTRQGVITVALTLAPSVILIALVSILTSYIIFVSTGKTDSVEIGDSFLMAVLSFALVPAVTEELLFRYLPLAVLGERNKRVTVILSSLIFALAHFSPFQLVYAFIAGVVFMSVDIVTDSIFPSLILHFINNLLSVIYIMCWHTPGGKIGLIVTVSLLLCLSIAVFVKVKGKLKGRIKDVFSASEPYGLDLVPLFFIIPAALLGASVLIG